MDFDYFSAVAGELFSLELRIVHVQVGELKLGVAPALSLLVGVDDIAGLLDELLHVPVVLAGLVGDEGAQGVVPVLLVAFAGPVLLHEAAHLLVAEALGPEHRSLTINYQYISRQSTAILITWNR